MLRGLKRAKLALALVAGLAAIPVAQAQDFAGKTLRIYVGTGPGTTYDAYARLLAERIGSYIPGNPGVIVENMAGAGGTKVADFLANVAPKDGTALGLLHQNLPLGQVLTPDAITYNLADFNWLGSITSAISVIAVWHEAPATTVDEARQVELFMGTTGRGSETYQVPTVMNNLLGTKFKVVAGYSALGEMDKAMEQGELHGRGGSLLSWTSRHADWVDEGKVKFLVQVGLTKDKSLENVPLLVDLAENEQDREILELLSAAGTIGRPLAAPPGTDAAVLAVFEKAFEETMKDEAFLKAAAAQDLSVEPEAGETIAGLVKKTVNLSEDRAKAFREAVGF